MESGAAERLMRKLWIVGLAGLAGCAEGVREAALPPDGTPEYIAFKNPRTKRSYGPPPPGYIKIVAEPVPNWRPEMMHQGAPDGPISWTFLGPRPITNEYWSGNAPASGRVISIAPHPTNGQIVYAAAASGGLWKSTTGGTSWAPLTDELSILNSGAVALDPANPETVYLGTGEYQTSSGGDGIFRSVDGGANWERIATTSQVGSNISKIVVVPGNPTVIHVSGSGGYTRSIDGGQTWQTRLTGSCSDLVVNPADSQLVFVGRRDDGVYRSLNGGDTLTRLSGGLPSTGARRVVLAIAASSPQTVYVAITNSSSGLLGLWKTIDGGDVWTQMTNTPNFPSPQASYDCALGVDPTNPDVVYGGGVFPSYAVAGVIRSVNGGQSWTDISVTPSGQVHPDQHAIAFGPGGVLWIGNDGGVWKTATPGSNWVNCNTGIVATQNYQIALHPTNANVVIGGTQDNGTIQRASADPWPQILSGDGGFAAYDFVTTSRRYITYVYLAVYRQYNGQTAEISGPWSGDSRNFIAPLVMDPNNQRTLLGGTDRVWRTMSADTTPNWTPISTNVVGGGGRLNAIAVARGASNTIYTGSTTGRVYVTTDASVWNNRSTGLPTGQISDVEISLTNPGVAYVSYHSTSGGRVWRTDNFGVTWTNVSTGLTTGVGAKALAVDWRFDPPGMFVGSGAGVWWSYDGGLVWTKDGSDLPNVNIGDLAISATAGTITAGTYGRGAWRAMLPTSPPGVCYANCDGSTTPPVLNVQDFTCFLQRYAAGESYANCDQSTVAPVLNVLDFTCFLQRYAEGCP
jgi:hypothetical protein